jgi:drug/metabolite transporter (DMT)-like permease
VARIQLLRRDDGSGDPSSPLLTDTSPDWTGITLIILGAICFSTAIPFIRWTDGLSTLTIAFWRAMFGFLFLTVLLPRYRAPLRVGTYRGQIGRLLALSGFLSATVVLYTYAVQHTTAAIAALLVNSAPLYVAVLGPLLLGEPRPRLIGISLGLAVTGTVLLSDPMTLEIGSDSWNGILAAALSGFTYAFVLLMGRGLRGKVTGLTQTLWSLGVLVLILAPFALRTPPADVGRNLHVLIPLGVFSLGASYFLYFQGLARVRAQIVSVVALFEPVSGVIMGMVFFAEIPNALGWVGAALVLFSIYLISR